MNPVLEEQLLTAFPQLYRAERGFSFECGDGWFTLLWHLSEQLQEMIFQLPQPEQAAYCALQVKQKFGALRFYLSKYTDYMFHATEASLEESKQLCEICGKPGTLHLDRDWLMTCCPTHAPAPR